MGSRRKELRQNVFTSNGLHKIVKTEGVDIYGKNVVMQVVKKSWCTVATSF